TCHSPLYGVCERQPRNWTSLITIACGHRTQRSGNRRNSCSASETVRSPDEEVRCPRFECYMPSVRGNRKLGFRPPAVKVPRSGARTNNIIPPLHYGSGDVPDPIDVLNELIGRFQKRAVDIVVTLQASE